jgi:1A family penicillin-binding protein
MAYRKRRQAPPALRFLGRLALAALKLGLLAALSAVAVAMWLFYEYSADLPDPEQLSRHHPFETTRIYARDGQTLLFELVDPTAGRRTVVPFQRIPRALKDATVAVEDAGFYTNPGVDLRGIVRAVWLNSRQECAADADCAPASGGSTITQQLVRGVLLPSGEGSSVTYERKLREAILAYQVSREYSKDQILSAYLNEVYYGNQAYGVEAAAQGYFGKHVWELSLAEASLIAGLPQSPTVLNPFTNLEGAKERQRITLNQMVKNGYVTPQQAIDAFNAPLNLVQPASDIQAPHFVFYVRELLEQRYGPDALYRGGLRVVTTLDPRWQAEAQRIAAQRIAELAPRNATNAAVMMMAPDGQILAMLGSADYNNPAIDGQVNVALSPRQPGSALKPIVYAAALQRGWTPATVIWDTPVSYPGADGGPPYEPLNYDNSFHGPMRLRMALANSLNIPAVKALEYVGVNNFVELAHAMGITTLNDPAAYGLPMALGSNEVRLLDLTAAYNTFSNGGRYRTPLALLKVTNSRGEVLESFAPAPGRQALGPKGEQIAYLITSILSDNEARQFMFGAGNVMEMPDGRPVAAKTGTSNEWRDSWAIGYTPDITVGVWVGNSNNTPMEEVAGSNGAGLIWRDVMLSYNADKPARPFAQPPGVVQLEVCADTGGLASPTCPRPIPELFVEGTPPPAADIGSVTVQVAGDGSCLAASYTPADQVREATFPVYPPAFREWAAQNGVPQPPTQPCPPPQLPPDQAIALLNPPSATGVITGAQVLLSGTARGPFALDVGPGPDPTSWQPIGQSSTPVSGGLLAIWQTVGLAPGEYTIRLRVSTPEGYTVTATQSLTIGS